MNYTMDRNTIQKIEAALKRGEKVELIPGKHGVIINRVKQENIAFIEKNKDTAK